MSDLPLLLGFWAAFALAVISPGPNFTVLLATSIRHGRGTALRVASGMVLGEILWGLAAVFGVAALAAGDPLVEPLLRVGGGLFLLYLALGALRSALRPAAAATGAVAVEPARGGVARGFVLMMLNPKAGLFWLSLTGLVLGTAPGTATALLAVGGAVLISALWHGLLAVAFTTRRLDALRAYPSRSRGGAGDGARGPRPQGDGGVLSGSSGNHSSSRSCSIPYGQLSGSAAAASGSS
jgi:threonine/homoserine/homoserine lactone efflux protein